MQGNEKIADSFRGCVPEAAFVSDKAILGHYLTCDPFEPSGIPALAVKPSNTNEIVNAIKASQQAGAKLVPISSGPPHLRGGSSVPQESASVVLDLSGMKRIVRIDRRNRVAIIEPGVTFDELRAAAKKEGMKPLTPLLPRASKSVVASYLETEPITSPRRHWDTTDPALCVEIVFGTGDVFRTGGAAGPGSLEEQWASGAAQKNPLGPAQTDFLRIVQCAQGTMGVVTWASVKLEILPSISRAYFVSSDTIEPLIELMYEMTRLGLGDEVLLLDNFALAMASGKTGTATLRDGSPRFSRWNVFYTVGGYEYLPEERLSYQEKDIGGILKKYGLEKLESTRDLKASEFADMLDKPHGDYWKHTRSGGAREIFFITTMDKAPEYINLVNELSDSAGVRIGVYLQPTQQGRTCHLEFILPYNAQEQSEKKRVDALFHEASVKLHDKGAFFSRPYGPWAALAYSKCPDTVKAIRMVKNIVDPAGVLNPGKICL